VELEKTVQTLEEKYKTDCEAWQAEKAKMEKEFAAKLASETERWHIEKAELLDKIKLSQTREEEFLTKINRYIDEANSVKEKKNTREAELFARIEELQGQLTKYIKAEEEEENSVAWNQPIVFTKQSGAELQVRGEWKGASAGGSLNNLTWRNNPQILLYLTKNTLINFTLFQQKSDHQVSMNFYVFRTYSKDGKRIIKQYNESDIVCEGYFSNLKPTKVSKETELPASANPYIIIPATFLPGSEGQWTLLLKSQNSVDVQLMDPAQNDYPCWKGQWQGPTAGGCTNFPTFTQNPMFHFQIAQQAHLEFHLFQEIYPFDSLGLYLLKAEQGQQQKLLAYLPSLELKHTDFRNQNEVTISADLPAGDYIIACCTFNPNKNGPFQLRLLSGQNINLVPLRDVQYVTAQGTWKGGKAGGSVNDPDSWVKNSQYHLTIKSRLTLSVILDQTLPPSNKPFGIGWNIYQAGARVANPEAAQVVHTSQYKPVKKNTEQVTLDPGSYVIVPTTFSADEQTDFTLSFTTQSPGINDNVAIKML